MRRFLVAAGMGTMMMLAPAAPALADPANPAQPQTQAVAVADQNAQRQPDPDKVDTGGGSKQGLWGLLGLLGLLGLAGMRKAKAHSQRDVGVGERPGSSGR